MIKFVRYVAVLLLLLSVALMAERSRQTASVTGNNDKPGSVVNYNDDRYDNPVWKGRVHTAGLLWLNITNFGLIGTAGNTDFQFREHCSGKIALGAELPGASGFDYLFGGGLMFGGYIDSSSTPESGIKFQGPLCTTAYEGWAHAQVTGAAAHPAMELWPTAYSSMTPGNPATKKEIVETSNVMGKVNCFYNPVYDSTANAHEQFTAWYTDKFTDNAFTGLDDFDYEAYGRINHIPMGVEVKQVSYAWSSKFAQKFIIVDYTLYNTSGKDIYNFFMGMFMDNDVTKATNSSIGSIDDLCGFKTFANVRNESNGEFEKKPINMAWVADNDGREPITGTQGDITSLDEPPAGSILDGPTSIFSLRVLRNPNPKLKYSFNFFNCGNASGSPTTTENDQDWGPTWKTGLHDQEFINDPDTGLPTYNIGWWGRYDLTYKQKGYGDGKPGDEWGYFIGQGGITEGRPLGDYGRYMVMSNGERDYDMTLLMDDGIAGADENSTITAPIDPANTLPIYKQKHKFKPWTPVDGTAERRVEMGNGADDKFMVSFGPLGNETIVSLATENGQVQKTAWRFSAGDSIKLTLAYIVSENFHSWLGQDPLNPNFSDLDNKVNWGDAFRNALWADRLYDVPMYDTQVRKGGKTKGDAWYGEDVGKDATYALKKGAVCWWNDKIYQGSDEGESNLKLDDFTEAAFDGTTSEDAFMKFGNTTFVTPALPADKDTVGLTADYGALYQAIVGFAGNGQPIYDNVRVGWGDSLLTHGDGVPDFSAPDSPPSPKIKVETEGTDVSVIWTTDNFGNLASSPEKSKDKFSNRIDFEGYQIWLSDSKNINDFVEVFSVDRVNYIYENIALPGDYLDIAFMDTPVGHPKHAPDQIVPGDSLSYLIDVQNGDSLWSQIKNVSAFTYVKKEYGNNKLITGDHTSPNLVDYSSRFLREESNTKIYEYKAVLKNKLLGKKQYVAITSSDYGDPKGDVPALKSSPAVNAIPFVPGKISGTDKVYVVPNPYRADVDYEALGWEKVADKWREVDRKIEFINVPRHSIIRIYTLAGDLVKTISHNGDANESNREGENVAKWNLLNQNDQAAASGIYLFCVEDVVGGKDKFVGKFVIIK